MKRPALILLGVFAIGTGFAIADSISTPRLAASASRIDFVSHAPVKGTFPKMWIHGSESAMDNTDPPLQVHWYNDHTVIMRENKAYNYEACFLYLIFGNDKVILLDQGSTSSRSVWPLRDVVDGVIADWCKRNGRDDIELIVANTHLHGDHYAAWNQFVDRPNTRLVGLTHEEVTEFWGITHYPEQRVEYDLGGRKLLIWGSPGHEDTELAFYDTATQLLCTGDMLYHGRCYVGNWTKWMASMDRLVKFADEFPITYLVNCHIEINSKGQDYPRATTYQPDEPPMEMDVPMLRRIYAFAQTIKEPGIYYTGDVFLCNETRSLTTGEKNPYLY
jgi:glyoxylase-like metal-dependent hydrolase (beta-lactamase superfamily II)